MKVFDYCVLAENKEIQNYTFNELFIEAVESFNIPLKLELKITDNNLEILEGKTFKFDELKDFNLNLIISYDENNSSDLRKQLNNFLNCDITCRNRNLEIF